MAKLPGIEDLGEVQPGSGQSASGSYDVSGFARGAQAIGQGEEKFGQGLEQAGMGASELDLAKSRYEYANANAAFSASKINLDSAMAHDQDWQTLPDRYTQGLAQVQQQAAAQISNPAMRQLFVARSADQLAAGTARAKQMAFSLEGNEANAARAQQGQEFINQGIASNDPVTRANIMAVHGAQIDAAQGRGFVSPMGALQEKQKFAEQFAMADAMAASEQGPDATRAKIAEIQGAGTSSLGNINVVYRGPLGQPSTPNSIAPKAMFQFLRQQGASPNEALLLTSAGASESGLNPNDVHDGGIGYGLFGHNGTRLAQMRQDAGAPQGSVPWQQQALFALQELRSRPEAAAVNAAKTPEDLARSEMAYEQPQGYTQGNPQAGHNYTGRLNTIRYFTALAGGKSLPEVAPQPGEDEHSLYSAIGPTARLALEGHLEGALHKVASDNALETYKLKGLATDDVTSMLTTGEGSPALDAGRVASTLGPVEAQHWQDARADAHAIWTASHDFPTLPEDEMQARIESLRPQAGTPGFDRRQTIYEAVQKRAERLAKLRAQDPAASVGDDPAVRSATAALDSQDPQTAQALYQARLAAQERAGIPGPAQSPITDAEAKQYAAALRPAARGQAAVEDQEKIINGVVDDVNAKFGGYAQQVMRRVLFHVTMKTDAADILATALQRYQAGAPGPLVTPDQARKAQMEQDAERARDIAGLSVRAAPEITPMTEGEASRAAGVPSQSQPDGQAQPDLLRGESVPPGSVTAVMRQAQPVMKPFWQAVDLLRADPDRLMPFFVKRFGADSVPSDLRSHLPPPAAKPKPAAQPNG